MLRVFLEMPMISKVEDSILKLIFFCGLIGTMYFNLYELKSPIMATKIQTAQTM